MNIDTQKILPAISNYKDLNKFIGSTNLFCILMDFQLAELASVIHELKQHRKKVLIHIDLIKGLTPNEFGAIYLIQNLKVDGIISTKPQVLLTAKKRNVIAIQRIFLKDSLSLEKSLLVVEKLQPDYLEILPALSTSVLTRIISKSKQKVLCGGLIQSYDEIISCLDNGAIGVTTSNNEFWNL